MDPRFAHIRDWIFDLDNCLYPHGSRLFELIDQRMTAYIERLLGVDATEARRVQKMHFHGSGTTLAGLMRDHDVDPHHFMGDVHDIPLDRLARDDRLLAALERLPGRKFIHTNGNAEYAWKVLDRLGIAATIDHLHDIFAADLTPKPELHGYQKLLDQFGIDPTSDEYELVLSTSWPFDAVTGGPDRYLLHATLIEQPQPYVNAESSRSMAGISSFSAQ